MLFKRNPMGTKTTVRWFDFVFDTYKTNSIKGHTRERNEIGVKTSVRKETLIAKKFEIFSKNSNNKAEVFKMVAVNIIKSPANIVEIMATHLEEVPSKNLDADLSSLQPCNHKETHKYLILHALDASRSWFKWLLIVTVDTDVVVLALCHFSKLDLHKLYIEIATGKIGDGFPFIYMQKHCPRRCVKHCPFGSLWLDVILFQCLVAEEKRRHGMYDKSIQK